MTLAKLKSTISVVLIISMLITTGGIKTLAESIDDVVKNEIASNNKKDNYYGETFSTGSNLLVNDDADGEGEGENDIYGTEDEPEEDTETTESVGESNDVEQDASEEPSSDIEPSTSEESSSVIESSELEETSETIDNTSSFNDIVASESEVVDEEISSESEPIYESIASESEAIDESIASESEIINDSIASTSDIFALNEIDLATDSLLKSATISIIDNNLFGSSPINNIIWFGTYPQQDATGVQYEPIKWRVLSQDGNEALLLAENILDNILYSGSGALWNASELRTWLNETFKNKAFTANQINNGIISKTISTNGIDTTDKIFLLSVDDAVNNNYFPNTESKKATGSNYAKNVLNRDDRLTVDSNGYSPWWLRSASSTLYYRATIDCDGYGNYRISDRTDIGVRPAFYANLSSYIIKTSNNNISFNLNGLSWKAESTLWGEMTAYQGGQKLPTAANLDNFPANKVFIGWTINGNLDNVVTELPINQTGDIVLSPVLGDMGDSIWFGTFPQHDKNGIIREPIKWRVLSNNVSGEALLVSDTILYNKPFNDTYGSAPWSASSIRSWLNNEFKNEIFTDEQINNGLVTKTIQTTGQSDTEDELFLLSLEEAEQLFSNNYSRNAVATNYAKNIDYNGTKLWTDNDYAYYWLRSQGYLGTTHATFVCEDGSIDNEGYYVNDCEFSGIRPAFYLNKSSPIFKSNNNSVTFNLNGGSWKEGSELWESFDKYQGGQKLPTKENIIAPRGYEFVGWSYSGETATISEIEVDKTGDIVLEAQYDFQHILDEYIWFGTYPQGSTNLLEMEPIRWRVLDQDMTTGEVFLVSEKVIDDCNYFNSIHEASIGLGWQGSVMREHLNTTFKNRAFTRTQIENGIIEKTIYSKNKEGNYDSTIDAVFLLSKDEVENTDYFSDANDRIAYPVSRFGWGISFPWEYWLRDIFDEGYEVNSRMMYVKGDGTIDKIMTYSGGGAIRPAICVNPYILNTSDNNITFDLNGGSWKNGSRLWQYFDKYQGGQKLPTIENINAPNGQMLMGWTYDGGATIINEIPSDMRGNITLKAVYDIPAYDIIWDLTDGSSTESGYFEGGATPSDFYVYGVGMPTIPINVIGPHGREFSHWEINGTKVTSITTSDYGSRTIKAVYNNEFWFGRYPQNDITGSTFEPIKWKLLYKNDSENEALYISEKIIDNVSYDETSGDSNFAFSNIRNWLVYTFFNDYGTDDHFNWAQKRIHKSGKIHQNSYGQMSSEWFSLFSLDELSYLDDGSSTYLSAYATPYAKNKDNNGERLTVFENGTSSWWLRSQSYSANTADSVRGSDLVVNSQTNPNDRTIGVRPIMWVDTTSQYYRQNNNIVRWELGDLSFNTQSVLWNDYKTYQPGQLLPTIDNVVVPTGYNLSGWHINDSSSVFSEIPTDQMGNIVLKPHLEIKTYDITYHRNGGVWIVPTPSDIRRYDQEVILPVATDIAKNDGIYEYEFKGWYTEDGSITGIWDETKKVTVLPANDPLPLDEYNLYARWELPTWEISFNMLNHGTTPSNIRVLRNTIVPSADRPASPNEIGYKFCGWYQNYNQAVTDFDSRYTNQFNFETDIVSADMTLYAKWKPITYTIRYNANGGSVSPATDIKIYDTNLTLANPTKVGYDFDAWYQNYESSTETFTNVYDGTIDVCTLDGDIKNVYAKWIPHEYIVDYDLGLEARAAGAMPPSSTITKTHGVPLADGVLQNPSVIPTGFVFIGWFKESAFINEWTGVDDLTTGTSPQTIYAKWNLIKYNITYDALGGTLPSGTSNTFIKTYSKAVTLVNPTRVGYDFDGWYANYNAETKAYSNPFNGQIDISTDTTGKTIYAKWVAHTYYITYELGGYANPITPKVKTYGVSYTPPTPESIITGYAFAGWYKELSYVNQYLGDDLTTGTTTQVVYAKWTQNPEPSPSPSPSPYNPGGGGGSSGGGGGGGGGGGLALAPIKKIPSVLSINTKKDIKAALSFNTCKWSYDPIKDKWQLKGDLENGLNINAVDGFYIVAREDENFNSLVTGKLVIETYYFDAQGDMWKGFVKTADNKTYYFDDSYAKREGLMAIGWTKIVDDWYYFGTDGTMLINSVTPDGYQVGEDGKWIQ